MKKQLLPIAAAVVLASAGTMGRADYPVQRADRQSHVLRPSGPEPVVDLRTFGGRIEVIADQGREVRLDVVTEIAAETEARADAAAREVRLTMTEDGPTVSAIVHDDRGRSCGDRRSDAGNEWQEPRYRVAHLITARIPRGARLQVCTVNTPEVVVDGPVGEFDISNVNGRISIRGARGNGRAVTVNGPVTVTLADVLARPSVFKTVNGDVTVTVPDPLSADLRMKTFNGELLTDFDVSSLPTAAAATTTRSRDGRFVFRSNQYTTVRAGRGGPEITLETLNGDVQVLRAAR